MEQDTDSSRSDDEEVVAPWQELLRQKADFHDFYEVTRHLSAHGEMPDWESDGSYVIEDLVSRDLFDVVEAIFDAKPFSFERLRVHGDWFANAPPFEPGQPSRLLALLVLIRRELLCPEEPARLNLAFAEVVWGEQELRYWIDCLPESTCELLLAYCACDFGDQQDSMLEAALKAPLLWSFTWETTVEQRPLSRRFCKLLRKHANLVRLHLPSISAASAEALAKGLIGNRALLELSAIVQGHGSHDCILQGLQGHPGLRKLTLGRLVAQDAHALAVLPSMPSLKVLTIDGFGEHTVVPDCSFESLLELDITTAQPSSNNETCRSVLRALCRCTRLRVLCWRRARIPVAFKELASQWMGGAHGRLLTLALIDPVGETAQVIVDCMAFNNRVRMLTIEGWDAEAIGSLSLEGLIKHPSLSHLGLSGGALSESACDQIAHSIRESSVLEHLSIKACVVSHTGVRHLCWALEVASTLREFGLEHSADAYQCFNVFKTLRRNRSLKTLHLCPAERMEGLIDVQKVEECLADQFALLDFRDRTNSIFDAQAAALIQTLLRRNWQIVMADDFHRWRLAVEAFVRKLPTAQPMPVDIAQPLWNSFVHTLVDHGGQQRFVLRSRAAWEALRALESIGRPPD